MITAADFYGFFLGVHGFAPYPWQQRLVRQVIDEDGWPEVVCLPTGSGKTSLVDVAVFALAARPFATPRRVVYVVNRRTVVDQAYKHVAKLQAALETSSDPSVGRVSKRLKEICGGAPINGLRLRGGVHRTTSWADRPDTAWATVSTVDQFGSQLLFRGYGSSPKMRPIGAGLAGNDCLVILDEAHLNKPFAQTLRQVDRAQPEVAGLPRRYHILEMSATSPEPGNNPNVFTLDDKDMDCSELVVRINSPKNAYLRSVDWTEPHETIPAEALRIVKELDDRERSVGVVVNRVRTARETHRILTEALAKKGYKLHLLTGRMRPLDRDRVVDDVEAAVDPDRDMDVPATRTVVVATQCIEVGADYSFDALITEVAPIDSLRQRFGRLDRRGRLYTEQQRPARAWIIGPVKPSNAPGFTADPVYGGAVAATWAHVLKITRKGLTPLDASPLAADKFPPDAYTTKLEAPLLLPHHMDAWAQTNPQPAQEPPIDRALHGMLPNREALRPADVSVEWRYDLDPAAIRTVPIRGVETLQVPWRAAVSWLEEGEEVAVSDAGTETVTRTETDDSGAIGLDWIRWLGHDTRPRRVASTDIKPGDLLVVNPEHGGLTHGTWDPSARDPVADLGDAAQHAYQRRHTLRLDRRLLPGLPRPPRPLDDTDIPDHERIDEWLGTVAALPDLPGWMTDTITELRSRQRRQCRVGAGTEVYFVLEAGSYTEADVMDGSDESQSATGAGVALKDHLTNVGKRTRDYARRLGLGEKLCADLETAARLHDIGKADPRFQKQMVGGDEVRLVDYLDKPLAKSLPQARPHPRNWPPVYHELLGVLMARDLDTIERVHDKELVLHLIGNHHGRARALPDLRPDPNPQTVTYLSGRHSYQASTGDAGPDLASEMAERFWQLSRKYGHHGLAWLEAIVRQADQQQSAHEKHRR